MSGLPERFSELTKIAPSHDIDARVRTLSHDAILAESRDRRVAPWENVLHGVVVGGYAIYAVNQVVRIFFG